MDVFEADELIKEVAQLNRKVYGRMAGDARTMGFLQAHVGFFLSAPDCRGQQARSTQMLKDKRAELLMEYMEKGDHDAR